MKHWFTVELYEWNDDIQLFIVSFVLSPKSETRYSSRVNLNFRWTKSIRALTILALATRINGQHPFMWTGGKGSLVSSLHNAICRCPAWTLDMFGSFQSGTPRVRGLFKVDNSERKSGSIVSVGINQNFISAQDITVKFNGKTLSRYEIMPVLEKLLVQEEVSSALKEKVREPKPSS